ncbi:hypothetical protein GXM_01113 [Nostoc sphaeroides CCNUC1]|uniref:Uncharacterized protein n=1 Tax=Nostoc sphaeroides CCNUC1 TaxID=2653204 RepID=A0A5P8VTD4_9NOSO|nr:hypothetical protein GXM_01113 [Nostoc sphaeroides CCNUC1]
MRQNESVNFWRAVVIYPQRSLDPDDQLPYQLLLNSSQVQRIYLDELDTGENSLQVAIVKLIIEREETAVDRFLNSKFKIQNSVRKNKNNFELINSGYKPPLIFKISGLQSVVGFKPPLIAILN